MKAEELTPYQANVFLILNDGRAGQRFRDEAALELIAKHSAMIADRQNRKFEAFATARAIIEAETCEDISAVIEGRADDKKDTARLDWLQSQSQGYGNGWIVRRRSHGGVAAHESAWPGRTSPTLREAIDRAMKEGL